MVAVARKNLLADKVRLLISVGGVAFAVLLILVVGSLYRGFQEQAGSFVEGVPGDVWVMEQDTADIFHSFSVVSEDKLGQVAAVPGVHGLVLVYGKRVTVHYDGGGGDTYIMALDLPQGTEVLHGMKAPGPGQIVLDDVFARKSGLSIGDSLDVRGRVLTVSQVGNVSNVGLSQFSLISAGDAREVLAVSDNVNYLLVSVEPGADASAVAKAIEREVPGIKAATKAEFAAANRNEITEFFIPIVSVLLAVAFLVGTAVVGLTIYTATVERTREYGVMKAIGASGGHLFRIVIAQSIAVGVAGFLVGVPMTLAVNRLAEQLVPEFVNVVRWQDVLAVFAAALAMAVIAAFVPVRRVASVDPAAVFRA